MARTIAAEVFPPGEIIKEELEERGWTQVDLAEILDRPLTLVNEIMTGRRAITPETAKGLGDAFGVDPQFFLNLESKYQLWRVAKNKGHDPAVVQRAELYAKVPVRELVRRRCIERSGDFGVLQSRVLKFYGVQNLEQAPRLWPVAARTKAPELSWGHWAWLVRAKYVAQGVMVTAGFTDRSLAEAMENLKLLLHSPEETRQVPRILADAGIRLVIVEHFPKTKWDGACFWLDAKSPVVALSMRYDRIDYFWHTLMHELWHVEKRHGLKEHLPIDENIFGEESERPAQRSPIEGAVDSLAASTLIPSEQLDDFIARIHPLYSKTRIKGFAARLKVHPGLVGGQLQHRDKIDWRHSREMLARVRQFLIGVALTDGWGHVVPAPPAGTQ
jgi:HTH-type transcriptional regulator/antitoxin HigA